MSVEVINPSKSVKARKEYRDMNREFIMEVYNSNYGCLFTPEEGNLIDKAIADGWKIKKGEIHEAGTFKYDGEIYTFRSKTGLSKICSKYDLWPED